MNDLIILISLLPGIILHLLWLSSILVILASVFIKRFPPLNKYSFPIRVGGFVFLLFLTYIEGAYYVNSKWEEKGKEMQEKVAQAEAKAAEENVRIEEKIVEKTKVIKEKGDVVVQYVDRLVKGDTRVIEKNLSESEREAFKIKIEELEKSRKDCPTVPQLLIEAHNQAAKVGAKGDKK